MIQIKKNALKVRNPDTGEYEGLAGLGGAPGARGESMYETAVRNGFVGSESDFLKEFVPDNLVSAVQSLTNKVDQILDGSADIGGGTVVAPAGLIIQEEEPEGDPNKTWIKPSTRIQHFFDTDKNKWVPLSATWGGDTSDNAEESGGDESNADTETI